ncbi:MAG: hypothetical protein ACE5EF_05580, partial [Dehalococcoidia bacterium]
NPLTVDGFLHYTINAFPQFKWAFPLDILPDRFMVYGGYVVANFGWPGVILAFVGAGTLAVMRPRTFLMLSLMWAVHVIFFLEYRAQDLEVFFLPSHLILVLAAGFGLSAIGRWFAAGAKATGREKVAFAGALLGSLLLVAGAVFQTASNYSANDRSEHTEINDFYANTYDLLPEGATLAGAGGVFGYDMFYYPLVYGTRPDVSLPAVRSGLGGTTSSSPTSSVYSVSPEGAGGRGLTVGLPGNAWSVPVLAAPSHEEAGAFIRRQLVLYEQSRDPPALVTSDRPQNSIQLSGTGADFAGIELDATSVGRGETVKIRLFWTVTGPLRSTFSLQLGGTDAPALAAEPGFGLWERYSLEVEPLEGQLVVDAFQLVVLSSTPTGTQPLLLTLDGTTLQIAELEVL